MENAVHFIKESPQTKWMHLAAHSSTESGASSAVRLNEALMHWMSPTCGGYSNSKSGPSRQGVVVVVVVVTVVVDVCVVVEVAVVVLVTVVVDVTVVVEVCVVVDVTVVVDVWVVAERDWRKTVRELNSFQAN